MASKELYLGVMSGTSLDGVDIALCEITADSIKLLASYEHPFPKELKKEVLQLIKEPSTLKQIGEMDVKLAELFSHAINLFLENNSISRNNITAIGLHGQTLWHEPNSVHPFSMQLGSGSVVAARCGIDTVTDFRNGDIANGGEGAPFAPAFHAQVFAHLGEGVGVVNIGGMANISYLEKETLGWDIGCGNVLLDTFMQRSQKKPYDRDGTFAKSGEVVMPLLQAMLKDEYFAKIPPKSTGREYFNEAWLDAYLQKFGALKDADIQRTLLELTALTIANEANRLRVKELILCGGGAKNSFLVERIATFSRTKVSTSDAHGVESDSLEAMIFAWLAYKRINKEAVNLSPVTGAKKNTILGAIYASS
jgi:anhydro-N-acetylmuramic acid kinase